MSEFKYATARTRSNSRGFVWIAWVLFLVCFLVTGAGVIGAIQLGSASFDFQKRDVLDSLGWAIEYVDAYFLMTVISIIWIQVCSVSADTEDYLVSIEHKINALAAQQQKQTESETTQAK